MRLHRAALTGLALVLATALSADAAPAKKVCNLLKDETGDWKGGTYSSQGSNALDILSADIATGKSELVVVVRVPTTDVANDNWRKLGGYGWMFSANLGGVDYQFDYEIDGMFGNNEETASVVVGNTKPKFTFTREPTQLVWKVKRSELASLNRRSGQYFNAIASASYSWGGTADTATADGNTRYVDKTPSCVVAK